MKMGSLFDGSGGFPLAASLCGIEPVWASEVEPYPIAVTRSRFPTMKHLGSVTDIHGGEIEPVDIITFGSPCQDLSVAGKRAGLKHEANGDEETTRSGLFVEAVRIIKEMREATNGEYPKFALWENVPGAFSSNKGEDFRTVLTELIRIVEPNAVVPPVPKAGWAYADSYRGDGWSLAYRVFDAQHWGVPQRRRRIHLVLDLRGERARKVLFECQGVRGYFAQSGAQGEGAAEDVQRGIAPDDRAGDGSCLNPWDVQSKRCYRANGCFPTLYSGERSGQQQQSVCIPVGGAGRGLDAVKCYDIGEARLRTPTEYAEKSPTITARCGTGGNNVPAVVDVRPVFCLQGNGIDRADTAGCNGKGWKEDVCYTLNTVDRPAVAHLASGKETVGTLMANAGTNLWLGNQEAFSGDYHIVEEKIQATYAKQAIGEYKQSDIASSQTARQYKEPTDLIRTQHIVRRLTPTECARLQGFPDKWGHPDHKDSLTVEEYRFWLDVRNTHAAINGKTVKEYTEAQMLVWYNKLHTDSAEYKMWGNGIALPPALYVLGNIKEISQ